MLLEGVRTHMGTITVALVIFAIAVASWRKQYEALLIAGGAAGTLACKAYRCPLRTARRLQAWSFLPGN